jgi:hypothetical protein
MTLSLAETGVPDDCDAKVRAFAEYWLSICPADRLPGRQHVDPVEIKPLLPNIWMLDVHRDPLRFKYRLVGSRIVDFYGWDPTGKWVDEAFERFNGSLRERDAMELVESGSPRWRRGKPELVYDKDFTTLERIYLPLATNGVDIDIAFCITVFIDDEGQPH